jgi:hypothetical protein
LGAEHGGRLRCAAGAARCAGLRLLLLRVLASGRAREPRLSGGGRRRLAWGALLLARTRLLNLIPARHHRDGAGRHGRRAWWRTLGLAHLCGLHVAARVTRRTECRRPDLALSVDHRGGARGLLSGGALLLCALLRGLLRDGSSGGLAAAGRGRFFCIVLAHDGGEVERFHLRRLIPGVLAGGAFQRTALLPKELTGQLKV